MQVGVFMMPSHPPERDLYAGHYWDLEHLELIDKLGFHEAWIGEHFTAPWEPNPAPDLLIAQALLRTKNIKLAPGAHLLPYHNPAELAHRVAYLDHMAQGRFMFGVGSSGLPGDWKLFNVDGMAGENRHMTREALDIILKLWESEEPFEYKGKYWRIAREVYIAETDKEAREKAVNGMLGRVYREYLLPLFSTFGFKSLFKHHPEVPDSDVTPEYLVDYNWLVGSPRTVTEKLGKMYQDTGGFGCLLVLTFDQSEN